MKGMNYLFTKVFLLGFLLLESVLCMAQNRIEGVVKNGLGERVEYASVRVDSFYTVSDLKGYFVLDLPKGERKELVITHLSYKPVALPWNSYKNGHVEVTMTENVSNLAEVSVAGKKVKEKKISHKGIKTPGDVVFKNVTNTTYEVGPIVSNKKDYLVKSLDFKVKKCSFAECVVRIIIYEIKGNHLTPIQRKPIYLKFSCGQQKEDYAVKPSETIMLSKGHDYYVGVAVVSSTGKGEIHFPAFLRKGYVRNLVSGKMKKLPATMGISMSGVEIQ